MQQQSEYSISSFSSKQEKTQKTYSETKSNNFQNEIEKELPEFSNTHYQNKFYDNINFLGWTNQGHSKNYKKRAKKIIDNLSENLKKEKILIGKDLKLKIINYGDEFNKFLKKISIKNKILTNYSILPVFFFLVKNELSDCEIFDFNFFSYYIGNKKNKFYKYLNLYKKYQSDKYLKNNNKEKIQKLVMYWLSRILPFYENNQNSKIFFFKAEKIFKKIFFFQNNFFIIFSSFSIKYLSLAISYIIFKMIIDKRI